MDKSKNEQLELFEDQVLKELLAAFQQYNNQLINNIRTYHQDSVTIDDLIDMAHTITQQNLSPDTIVMHPETYHTLASGLLIDQQIMVEIDDIISTQPMVTSGIFTILTQPLHYVNVNLSLTAEDKTPVEHIDPNTRWKDL